MNQHPRTVLQATVAQWCADVDALMSRLEALQHDYPSMIAELQSLTEAAQRSIKAALADVEQRVAPTLLRSLEAKAREAQAQMIATVAETAGESAARTLRGQVGVVATVFRQLVQEVRTATQEMHEQFRLKLWITAAVGGASGAFIALVVQEALSRIHGL
jgi:hypothetical protein